MILKSDFRLSYLRTFCHKYTRGDRMKTDKDKEKNSDRLPFGEVFSGLRMTVHSNREIDLEGCKGILEYCSDSIKVNAGKFIIAFRGRGMQIKCMSESELIIEGYILGIEYIN